MFKDRRRPVRRHRAGTTFAAGLLAIIVQAPLAAAARPATDALPDPTLPPATHASAVERLAVAERESFVVSAIRISDGARRAIVNDQLVGEGDRVGGGTVLEIVPGAVVIEYLSERSRIALLPGNVRRPHAEGTGP